MNCPTQASPASSIKETVDEEVVRAQMVNSVLTAFQLMHQNHPDLRLHLLFLRQRERALQFCLRTAEVSRYFRLELLCADGTEARVSCLDGTGAVIEPDEFSFELTHMLGQVLPQLLSSAVAPRTDMPLPVPTHVSTRVLQ